MLRDYALPRHRLYQWSGVLERREAMAAPGVHRTGEAAIGARRPGAIASTAGTQATSIARHAFVLLLTMKPCNADSNTFEATWTKA